jgi:hypothetical protein
VDVHTLHNRRQELESDTSQPFAVPVAIRHHGGQTYTHLFGATVWAPVRREPRELIGAERRRTGGVGTADAGSRGRPRVESRRRFRGRCQLTGLRPQGPTRALTRRLCRTAPRPAGCLRWQVVRPPASWAPNRCVYALEPIVGRPRVVDAAPGRDDGRAGLRSLGCTQGGGFRRVDGQVRTGHRVRRWGSPDERLSPGYARRLRRLPHMCSSRVQDVSTIYR